MSSSSYHNHPHQQQPHASSHHAHHPPPAHRRHSVIFVCYGNICRSPIAEAIFRDLLRKRGIENLWSVDSAATSTEEIGNPIYDMAQDVLHRHGIHYQHLARQIEDADYDRFELIIGFDDKNIDDLERLRPASVGKVKSHQIRLMNYFNDAPQRHNKIIVDPWYVGTPEAFESVFEDCYRGCMGILRAYENKKQ